MRSSLPFNLLTCLLLFVVACDAPQEQAPPPFEEPAPALEKKVAGEMRIHLNAAVEGLNPHTYTGADAGHIIKHVYQSMVDIDFETLEITPVLAESRAVLEEQTDGTLHITYNIRPEAAWDDGTPITVEDVLFAFKISLHGHIDNGSHRTYYEFVRDVLTYPDNPKKFTVVAREPYLLAEAAAGDVYLLPRSVYDPKGLLADFTLQQFINEWDAIADDARIVEFAELFNQDQFATNPAYLKGSGAYNVSEWVPGQRLVLERKQNWWGDKTTRPTCFFEAWPQTLNYQVVKDYATAEIAVKGEKLDLLKSIPPDVFLRMKESEKIASNYTFHSPDLINYSYIGLNTRDPRLADLSVRHALAHVANVPQMIDVVLNGLGKQIVGPVHPSKPYYNKSIEPWSYDPAQAKQLLAEAGWGDADGDGVLDKTIDGKLHELEFTYLTNPNPVREAIGELFAEEARKVGIKINVELREFPQYVEALMSHNFDIFIGKWVQTPLPRDHKQIYHTESYAEGHNFVGFGNAESDALIDDIRSELDEEKRAEMNLRFQEICHQQAAYLFLFSETNNIVVHKRVQNLVVSEFRPGYWEGTAVIAP